MASVSSISSSIAYSLQQASLQAAKSSAAQAQQTAQSLEEKASAAQRAADASVLQSVDLVRLGAGKSRGRLGAAAPLANQGVSRGHAVVTVDVDDQILASKLGKCFAVAFLKLRRGIKASSILAHNGQFICADVIVGQDLRNIFRIADVGNYIVQKHRRTSIDFPEQKFFGKNGIIRKPDAKQDDQNSRAPIWAKICQHSKCKRQNESNGNEKKRHIESHGTRAAVKRIQNVPPEMNHTRKPFGLGIERNYFLREEIKEEEQEG